MLSLNFKTSKQLTSLKAYATEGLLVMSPLAFISKLEQRFVKSRETLKLEPGFFC